jgi:hypothetical protein
MRPASTAEMAESRVRQQPGQRVSGSFAPHADMRPSRQGFFPWTSAMQNFADVVRGYAQECADFACAWPLRGQAARDLFLEITNRSPMLLANLSCKQVDWIQQAILLGTVAGRPRMEPAAVQYCRSILVELQARAQEQQVARLVEECFDIGYRAAVIG